MFRLFTALYWIIYWAFESAHDWHTHVHFYKKKFDSKEEMDAYAERKNEWKLKDTGMHIAVMCMFCFYEVVLTGDFVWALLMGLIYWSSGWMLHEAWYSYFSNTTFGKFGGSAWSDRILNGIKITVWQGRALLVGLPLTLIVVAMLY